MSDIDIRPSRAADKAALDALYALAFPEEDLHQLVWRLLEIPDRVLSLAACRGDQLAGHIIFTRCTVDPAGRPAALLGPLCVAPGSQRQGLGGGLIGAGLTQLAAEQTGAVYVLGDPAYYGRHGFSIETRVTPPYPLPAKWREAWQSQNLVSSRKMPGGTLAVPPPWQDPALWA